jgi:hypothetical protein
MKYWLLNTDEAELPGQGAYGRMKARSVAAAWGSTYGAEGMLSKPEAGDRVFFYLKSTGIIFCGTFDHSSPFSSNDIFRKQQEGEFSRKVVDLAFPKLNVVSPSMVKAATGSPLPTNGSALHLINNLAVIEFINSHFS